MAGARSYSFIMPSVVATELMPTTTIFEPLIRTIFLVAPTLIDAPIRGVVALLSAIVATFLPPKATTAAPGPITTS